MKLTEWWNAHKECPDTDCPRCRRTLADLQQLEPLLPTFEAIQAALDDDDDVVMRPIIAQTREQVERFTYLALVASTWLTVQANGQASPSLSMHLFYDAAASALRRAGLGDHMKREAVKDAARAVGRPADKERMN